MEMKYFTDPSNGSLWAYNADGSEDHVILDNLVPVSNEEAQARINAPPILPPIQQIEQIEADNPITHRSIRDLSKAVAELIAEVKGVSLEDVVPNNPGMKRLLKVEAEIAAIANAYQLRK